MRQRRIKRIIFHWSASPTNVLVSNIRAWHLERGFRDIGYHRVILHPIAISRDTNDLGWFDLVKLGRGLDADVFLSDLEAGAHTHGFNRDSVGVCVVGGPGYPLHMLQKQAIVETAKILIERFELPARGAVFGHRDFNKTLCPGDEIYKLIQQFK